MRPIRKLLTVRNSFTQPPFWSQPSSIRLWQSLSGDRESIESDFVSLVQHAYKESGIVFAVILARMLVFSEARFLWRRYGEDGRPTDLFRTPSLQLLEKPWPNGTTGELLARVEQNASMAGNFYAAVVDSAQRLRVLRPDWVTIVTGSPTEDPFHPDAKPIGYVYLTPRRNDTLFTPDQIVHYSPIPDPIAQWRGMSWLTPALNDISGDKAAAKHKLKFFEHGAFPGMVLSYDANIKPETFERFVELFRATHEGVDNAYKTLHLGGGADPKPLQFNFEQLDFKAMQGAAETRIAAAGGVHPVIAGFSEGMQGSSLNAGNFAAARRRFADGTIRPLLRIAAASFESILDPEGDAHLWYDDRDIPFFREDAAEEAEIQSTQASTIANLVREGFTWESAVAAVIAGDFSKLEHTGLYSVQLQPITTPDDESGDDES